jgi:hypothetical protein
LECILLACTLDPDDAANFLRAATTCIVVKRQETLGKSDPRGDSPELIASEFVVALVVAAFACRSFDSEDLQVAQALGSSAQALGSVHLPIGLVEALLQERMAGQAADVAGPRTLAERRELAVRAYGIFASDVTAARRPDDADNGRSGAIPLASPA